MDLLLGAEVSFERNKNLAKHDVNAKTYNLQEEEEDLGQPELLDIGEVWKILLLVQALPHRILVWFLLRQVIRQPEK